MNKVKIRIAGKDHWIVGTEAEEYIQKIGLYVDKKMTDVMKAGENNLSTVMASVLVSVNIADDYFSERDRAIQQKSKMNEMEKQIKELHNKLKTADEKILRFADEKENLKLKLVERETELRQAKKPY